MIARGLKPTDLPDLSKGDPRKALIAQEVRTSTAVPL